jgi:hypothetical protein
MPGIQPTSQKNNIYCQEIWKTNHGLVARLPTKNTLTQSHRLVNLDELAFRLRVLWSNASGLRCGLIKIVRLPQDDRQETPVAFLHEWPDV